MGIVYYLARPDSFELYEIGKLYAWRQTFHHAGRGGIRDENVAKHVTALLAASRDAWGLECFDVENCERIVRDVLRWSEGRPFLFLSEHDALLEDELSSYRTKPDRYEWSPLRVTGSRYVDDPLPTVADPPWGRVEVYSNWCSIDQLDGVALQNGDRLRVRWPDGREEVVAVTVVDESYEGSDHGHSCRIFVSRAYHSFAHHGVIARVPLVGLEARREKIAP